MALRDFNHGKLCFPANLGGHPHGVKIGDEFNYKAELALMGIHRAPIRGIDFK